MSDASPPPGFRRLRLVERRRESAAVTSFVLEPVGPEGWSAFRPGQFLVFRVPAPDAPGGHVLRNYSISGPSDGRSYRVSVKREVFESGQDGAGLGSGHFHHRFEPGGEIWASAPRGEFVLDEASRRAVLLLSGGIGQTPLLAMLHRLAGQPGRPVHFIHACEDGRNHAMAAEVEALARRRPGIRASVVYRAPSAEDRASGAPCAEGLVDRDLLQRLLPLDAYDAYLCGPPAFMRAMHDTLRSLGIPAERIAYEFFGPASLLGTEAPERPAGNRNPPLCHAEERLEGASRSTHDRGACFETARTAPPQHDEVGSSRNTRPGSEETVPAAGPPPAASTVGTSVAFARSGVSTLWNPGAGSLLELAEGAGLSPAFSCRAGICMTCSAPLVSGEVDYSEDPLDEPPAGHILLCCTRPRGDVVIDI